jgi:O-antigen ligase
MTAPSPPPSPSPVIPWTALLPAAFLAVVALGLNVVVDPTAYDVSQLPRLLVLSAVLLAVVPLVAVPAVSRRLDTAVLREPVVAASAAYLVSCVASLAFALNVSAGWTDVFRTFDAFVVLVVACLLLPLAGDWRRLVVQALVLAAATAATLGAYETASLLGPGLHSRRAMEVVTARMSNVNLYAGLLALLLPWCVGGCVILGGAWRLVAAATAVGTLGMIVLVQSRGAWLAVAAAGLVAAAAVIMSARRLAVPLRLRRRLLVAGGLGVASLVAGIVVTGTDTPLGRTLLATFIARPHQAAGPSDGGRTMIWGVTARMIADHALVGVGAGNFTVRLHEYYGDDLDFSNLSSDNWIQPHNDFLWVFAEKGLPGIVAFAAIFLTAFAAIRRVLAAGSVEEARLAVVCLAALVAYVVLSCVDFPLDRITHQVHLAILLAVVSLGSHAVRPVAARPLRLPGWAVVPPVAAVLVMAISYAAAALDQERHVMAARRAGAAGDFDAMRAEARRATTPWKTLDPLATPVAFLEGMANHRLGRRDEALVCMERAFGQNPNRIYIVNNLGGLYAESGRFDEAIACFAVAADRYPDRIEPRHNLAACLVEAGRYEEAVTVLEDVPEPLRPPPLADLLDVARARLAEAASRSSPD